MVPECAAAGPPENLVSHPRPAGAGWGGAGQQQYFNKAPRGFRGIPISRGGAEGRTGEAEGMLEWKHTGGGIKEVTKEKLIPWSENLPCPRGLSRKMFSDIHVKSRQLGQGICG